MAFKLAIPPKYGGVASSVAMKSLAGPLQDEYPADLRSVKQHLFNMCYGGLQVHTDLRAAMHKARTLEQACATPPPSYSFIRLVVSTPPLSKFLDLHLLYSRSGPSKSPDLRPLPTSLHLFPPPFPS